MSKSTEFGHSADISMWLEVPVWGVCGNSITLKGGPQVLVTVIDGVESRSQGHYISTGDLDAGLADMAIKELQGQLAEATVEIEALSKALCDGNDELLKRRKELEEARRLAEYWRDMVRVARRITWLHGEGPDDMTKPLPWEGEK